MASQLINLTLPKELVKKIDIAAKGEYASRSEYIRQAVVGRLRSESDEIWSALEATATEVTTKAEQAGYITDEDFVNIIKHSRKIIQKA